MAGRPYFATQMLTVCSLYFYWWRGYIPNGTLLTMQLANLQESTVYSFVPAENILNLCTIGFIVVTTNSIIAVFYSFDNNCDDSGTSGRYGIYY